jgi:MFS family permease
MRQPAVATSTVLMILVMRYNIAPQPAVTLLQGTINWSTNDLSQLFAVIYYSSLITGIPAGILSDRYGPKVFLLSGLAITIFSTALLPVVAIHLPYWYSWALRFVFGLGFVSQREAYQLLH